VFKLVTDELEPEPEPEPAVVSAAVDGPTWGGVPPKNTSSTFLKFSARSIPPSNAPVPQGGLWHPRFTMPLTPSMNPVPVIPSSTNLRSSVV